MNKFEILAQAKTRRAKCETQVSILSHLAIPIRNGLNFLGTPTFETSNSLKDSIAAEAFSLTIVAGNPAEASITTSKASEAKTNLFVFISEP